MHSNKALDILVGLCVGDALGVPVEFKSREVLTASPVTGMQGYGTHNQPAGTWSDDSSLALCLAECLYKGYDLEAIAKSFVRWYSYGHWTPHGKVFDIGIATSQSLYKLSKGGSPLLSGGVKENENGNGSLMRIMPVIFYAKDKTIQERFRIVEEVSAITHAHIRSILACFIYIEYALQLLKGLEKFQALQAMKVTVNKFLKEYEVCPIEEIHKFHRFLENPIGDYQMLPLHEYPEDQIRSSGYVVHTLEASLWCFLTTDSYKEAVLKAVNLGEDTDTTGCVTGGLAGLYHGLEAIPKEWIEIIARKDDILALADKLDRKYSAQ